jgi:hypothetical protein
MTPNEKGFALVLTKVNRADIARHLHQSKQGVYKWTEVPFKHVLKVEELTGIPRDLILPEMAAVFRQSPKKDLK